MNPSLRIKLATYIYSIAGKTVDNMIQDLVKDQEEHIRKEEKIKADPAGLKFYEDLLKMLKPEKAPQIDYFKFLEDDELPPPETFPVKKK